MIICDILFMSYPFLASQQVDNVGALEMATKSLIFLVLLGIGGYLFVVYFKRCKSLRSVCVSKFFNKNDINVISMRHLAGRTYMVAIEHFGKRFLLAVSDSKVEKISEWETKCDEQHNSQHSYDSQPQHKKNL